MPFQYQYKNSHYKGETILDSCGTILSITNKANLRNLIAATGLVILLKLNSNCRFFSLCHLEIPLQYYIKLCASFQIHQWIQTEVTVRKRSIRVTIGNFFSRVTLKFEWWLWKTTGHLFYATLIFVHHFKAIREFKLELHPRNAQFASKSVTFCPAWPQNLMEDL